MQRKAAGRLDYSQRYRKENNISYVCKCGVGVNIS